MWGKDEYRLYVKLFEIGIDTKMGNLKTQINDEKKG